MSSHIQGTTTNVYSELSGSRHRSSLDTYSANPSRHRVRTYTAHALILFNVYGLPLSSGLWLEYYFTSLHSSGSLLAASAIFGVQFVCLGLAVGITEWAYQRWPKYWRLHMFPGGLSVCGAWLGLLIANNLWVLVLCQGALTGLGLGVLGTVSLLVLSTHYKNDITVASTQCVAAGFFGAAVYTVLTWMCLRAENIKLAYGVTLILVFSTLLTAICLTKSSALKASPVRQIPPPNCSTRSTTKRTVFTLLTTLSLAPFALFLPLILTRHPSVHRADTGPYALLSLASAAMLSSLLIPRIPQHRLSPTTLFTTTALLASLAIVPMLWMPMPYISVPCGAVFGVGLGGVCVLWTKTLAALVEAREGECLRGWVLMFGVVGGLGGGCGVVGAAAVLERWEGGVKIVLGVVAGWLGLGGLMVELVQR